jgi:hypothetical protein
MSDEHRQQDHVEPFEMVDEGPEHHDHDHDEHDHEGHHHGHEPAGLEPEEHRAEAVSLFNGVWQMLDMEGRTSAQDDQMVHAAHASRWHWSQAGELSGDQQLAVGEWQCSRVYSVLGRGEPALHHAKACLAICEENSVGDWVMAAAYEALARASAVAGDAVGGRAWLARARTATAAIADPKDREVIDSDLAALAALSILAGA